MEDIIHTIIIIMEKVGPTIIIHRITTLGLITENILTPTGHTMDTESTGGTNDELVHTVSIKMCYF